MKMLFDFRKYISEEKPRLQKAQKMPIPRIPQREEKPIDKDDRVYYEMVKKDYMTYFDAPMHLKKNYYFCIQALNACCSYKNNEEVIINSKLDFPHFIKEVRRISEKDFCINEYGFYVENPHVPKRLVKRSSISTLSDMFKL